jgi:hypothetical protein
MNLTTLRNITKVLKFVNGKVRNLQGETRNCDIQKEPD